MDNLKLYKKVKAKGDKLEPRCILREWNNRLKDQYKFNSDHYDVLVWGLSFPLGLLAVSLRGERGRRGDKGP